MRFSGRGLFQWDTWCHVAPDGVVHAFYLQQLRPGSDRSPVEADSIGHATSTDLLEWEEHPPVVAPSPPGSEGDLVNWTGSTVERDGTFYLTYTIRSSATEGRVQSIGLATSTDLWHWEKHPGPVLEPDPRWYNTVEQPGPGGVVDCRDLMVVEHPTRPGWWGVFATRVVSEELPEGAVFGGAYSEDLVHWEQTPPVYRSPTDAYSIVEMPDLFELDGRWYLTWLEDHSYGNRGVLGDPALTSGTVYAVADAPEGPFVEPPDNVLMASRGFNGISCRTLQLDGRLYVTYTSCERDGGNEFRPTFGALSLPKEVRLVDGALRWCFAERVRDRARTPVVAVGSRAEVVPLHAAHETRGRWTEVEGGWTGTVRTAWARQSFAPVVTDFLATVDVRLEYGAAVGLLLRQAAGHPGAVALLDMEQQSVQLCSFPRFQVVDARAWQLEHGRTYRLRVVGNGPFVEVFVDEVLVLQCVWYGSPAGQLGLLVDRGSATFRGLEVLSFDA